MSLEIIAAMGAKRDVSEISVRDESGTPRLIAEIWVRDENNVSRQVWGGKSGGGMGAQLSATASPDYVIGSVARPNSQLVSTRTTTVEPNGGVSPYSYSWDSAAQWTVAAPNGATTAFSRVVESGTQYTHDFTCTVTDSKGVKVTAIITADVSNYYSGGGGGVIQ